MQNNQIKSFTDTCILYFSNTDNLWIAHSLHTDQIGTGKNIIDALIDIMCGLNNLWALTQEDHSIGLFREAPAKIQRLAQKAEPLPDEISQIALRKVLGNWPKGLEFNIEVMKKRLMSVTISEPLPI